MVKTVFIKHLTVFFLIIALVQFTRAQELILPENIGSKVNSRYDEINPILSKDGKTLYFSRKNHPQNRYGKYGSQDIWYSNLQPDSTWGEAKRLDNTINLHRYNTLLSISPDGRRFLISGLFTSDGEWYEPGLSIINKAGKSFAKPEPLFIPHLSAMNQGRMLHASINNRGNTIVLAFSKSYMSRKLDIYISEKLDNIWSVPKPIKSINTSRYSEESPVMNDSATAIYFTSNRRGRKNFDIYRSRRQLSDKSQWSEPELLKNINTSQFDGYLSFSANGKTVYYSSKPSKKQGLDIYKASVKDILPYVQVSGYVKNKKNGEKISSEEIPFTLLKSGDVYEPDPELQFNKDSSFYSLKVPFNTVVKLWADAEGFETSDSVVINTMRTRNYTSIKKDIFLSKVHSVTINGYLQDKNTLKPIAAQNDTFAIYFDNQILDSSVTNRDSIAFNKTLKSGKKHSFSFKSKSYLTKPVVIDFSNVEKDTAISISLVGLKSISLKKYSDKNLITITGKVTSAKTGEKIDTLFKIAFAAEGIVDIPVYVDTLNKSYKAILHKDYKYEYEISAHGYFPDDDSLSLDSIVKNGKYELDLELIPVEEGQSIRLKHIYFELGKSILKPESYPELERVIEFLNENPGVSIELDGHSDNVGDYIKNAQLSIARARTCMQYLMSRGAPCERVSYNGFGSDKPIADNNTAAGRAKNRRVEVVIKEIK